jgi:hypothetical protein
MMRPTWLPAGYCMFSIPERLRIEALGSEQHFSGDDRRSVPFGFPDDVF